VLSASRLLQFVLPLMRVELSAKHRKHLAGLTLMQRLDNNWYVMADDRLVIVAHRHQPNLATGDFVLIRQGFVSGKENIKSGSFHGCQKLSVFELAPAVVHSPFYFKRLEKAKKGRRDITVCKNPFQEEGANSGW
jgi:hypothetical protein